MCDWARRAAIDVYSLALFAGAPVAGVAAAAPRKPRQLAVAHLGKFWICGFATFSYGHLHDGTRYVTCVNSACPQFDVPLQRADPAVVRRVRTEEEAAERERQREEKEMRELHSGVAISRKVARGLRERLADVPLPRCPHSAHGSRVTRRPIPTPFV